MRPMLSRFRARLLAPASIFACPTPPQPRRLSAAWSACRSGSANSRSVSDNRKNWPASMGCAAEKRLKAGSPKLLLDNAQPCFTSLRFSRSLTARRQYSHARSLSVTVATAVSRARLGYPRPQALSMRAKLRAAQSARRGSPATTAPSPTARLQGGRWLIWRKQFGKQFLGDAAGDASRFPLLIKFLFPTEKLSVQVHPDDEGAAKVGQPCGKTECWYVLRADPGAQIGLGLKPGTSKAEVETGDPRKPHGASAELD